MLTFLIPFNSKNCTSIHKALSEHEWTMQCGDYSQLYGYFTQCSVKMPSTKDLWIFMNKDLDLSTKQ